LKAVGREKDLSRRAYTDREVIPPALKKTKKQTLELRSKGKKVEALLLPLEGRRGSQEPKAWGVHGGGLVGHITLD